MGWDLWLGEVEQGVEGIKELREYTEINGWNLVENRKMEKIIWLPWWLDGKASACNAGDLGLIPGSGRSPGEGLGNLLQYSCLENFMDGGAWLGYSPCGRKELDTLIDWVSRLTDWN